jgi:hypothetical protein
MLALALTAPQARAGGWADEYRRALQAMDENRLDVAQKALEGAIAVQPKSDAAARTYGTRTVGYYPYLYLSKVAYRQRDLKAAQRAYAQELEQGVAQGTDEGRALLDEQELLLENLEYLQSAENGTATNEGRPVGRTERDKQREALLAQQVAAQCGQRPAARRDDMPWYYHYTLAHELADHGDWIGSLQQLALALDRRSDSGKFVRTYGMGFVDYRPWFDMGRAHSHLGNWQCSRDALELSAVREPMGEADAQAERERAELLAGARKRAGESKR